jgi:hypothetical protein
MFPYLIAGVIGYGIAKLFEEDESPKYADGGSVLLAPNGEPSNLTPEQYKLVRLPEFKAWFGDWENDPENSSKVVDSNGEPLVVYHGTDNDFNDFKSFKNIHFFTQSKNEAHWFVNEHKIIKDKKDIVIKKCFLNIRKIFNGDNVSDLEKQKITNIINNVDDLDDLYLGGDYLYYKKEFGKEKLSDIDYILFLLKSSDNYMVLEQDVFINWFMKEKYNGFIVTEYGFKKKNYAVFNSNQIKLADGTNTTFDSNNPDIRFDEGGGVKNTNEIKGSYVWEYALYYGSENHSESENPIFDAKEQILETNYVERELLIPNLIKNDVDLKDFFDSEKQDNFSSYKKGKLVNKNIIIGDSNYSEDVVIDGYHRIVQSIVNGENTIKAFVPTTSRYYSKYEIGGLINYGNSFGKIIKEEDGVYTIETENGDIKKVYIKYSTPYLKKELLKSNNDYEINKYENNLGELSENQKNKIINKIGLFNVDLFFKSHKTLKKRKELFDLFDKNEENIKDIQSKRHILHSTDEEDLFNSSNSLYSREFNDNIRIVADIISQIKIIGIENKFNSFVKDFDDSESGNRSSDIDLDYLDEYVDLDDEKIRLLNLIKIEKEKLNFAIELYLSYLDEVWDKLNLDEFKDNYHWKKKDFKPSGFLRNRLL